MTLVLGCNLEESKIFCFGGITKRGGGLAACRFKANQQAGLVERKVGSISDVRNWGQGWVNICPKADSPIPPPREPVGQELLQTEVREGIICRNSTVSSDSPLQIGHQWGDQCHLDGFRYSQPSVPGSICSLKLLLGIVTAYLVDMVWSSRS